MTDRVNLHALWTRPDNSRVTRTQYSFRLPLHVAAKIEALEKLYPNKTRTEIVADLLSSALADVETSFPFVKGRTLGMIPGTDEEMFEDAGPGATFRRVANRRYAELEKELGNDKPQPLYPRES
jgi:hypothetical protein